MANQKAKPKLLIVFFAMVLFLLAGCNYPEKTHEYEDGTFNLDDGTQFEGLMVNGLPLAGRALYTDGSIYEGSFENGIQHGDGYLVLPGSREIFGTWENGLCIEGSYFFETGHYYDGQLKDYKAHGEGSLTFNENGLFIVPRILKWWHHH